MLQTNGTRKHVEDLERDERKFTFPVIQTRSELELFTGMAVIICQSADYMARQTRSDAILWNETSRSLRLAQSCDAGMIARLQAVFMRQLANARS